MVNASSSSSILLLHCQHTKSMLSTRLIHQIVLYTSTIISLLGNTLLIAVVLHKKCRVLGTYRALLIIFACVDIAISINIACFLPVFAQIEYGVIVIYLDSFKMPDGINFFLGDISTCLYFECFPLLTFLFIYRYLVLAKPNVISKNMITFAVVAVLFNLTFLALIVYVNWLLQENRTDDVADAILLHDYGIDMRQAHPPRMTFMKFLASAKMFQLMDSDKSWNLSSFKSLVIMACSLGINLAISVTFAYRTARMINNLTSTDRRKHLQAQLFRALLVQFAIPCLLYILPLTFIIFAPLAGRNFGKTSSVIGMICAFYPALDPYCVMLVLPKFRKILKEWCCGVYSKGKECLQSI